MQTAGADGIVLDEWTKVEGLNSQVELEVEEARWSEEKMVLEPSLLYYMDPSDGYIESSRIPVVKH